MNVITSLVSEAKALVRPPVPAPYGMLAELTHRCPLQCPYCSNPVDLDRRNAELDLETLAAGVLARPPSSACCRCICPAASRPRGATSRR